MSVIMSFNLIVLLKNDAPDEKNAKDRFLVELTRLIRKNIHVENISGTPFCFEKISEDMFAGSPLLEQ